MKRKRKYLGWSKRIERNILSTYLLANDQDRTEGLYWYQHANEIAAELGKRFGFSIQQVAGVIAALSPGNPWGRNLLDTELVLEAYAKGIRGKRLPNVGVYGWGNVRKAERILAGENAPFEVLGGQKTVSFYFNITEPNTSNAVTIDRHAKSLAYGIGSKRKGYASSEAFANVSKAEYPWLAKHYRNIAERLDIVPSQLQAITWVTWKRLGEKKDVTMPDWVASNQV